jgi:hypothetical protein
MSQEASRFGLQLECDSFMAIAMLKKEQNAEKHAPLE